MGKPEGTKTGGLVMSVALEPFEKWIVKKTRPAWKYSPVAVVAPNGETASEYRAVVENRVRACKELGVIRHKKDTNAAAWYGFLHDQLRERNLRSHNVPIFVLSGGASARIKAEFDKKEFTLAWHPAMAKGEPVYLFVHKHDHSTYLKTLDAEFSRYRNLFLVGWDGGEMTGFGAARAAVLAYAARLPYKPQRIVMMDQDVAAMEDTRPSKPEVDRAINQLHDAGGGTPVVGYGMGFATRVEDIPSVPSQLAGKSTKEVTKLVKSSKKPSKFSPVQQFVSIKAPFRNADDGAYPAFMVAGGEDMLMTMVQKGGAKQNSPVLPKPIVKLDLGRTKVDGDADNVYWNHDRLNTLTKLYEAEKSTAVTYLGSDAKTIEDLCAHFVTKGHIDAADVPVTSALIIERIILKAYIGKEHGSWPNQFDGSRLMNRINNEAG